MTQLGAVYVVSESPGLLQKELAVALCLGESAVTGLVARMEKADLIERRPSPDDRRVSCLYPTARAAALRKKARPFLAKLNARITDGFSDQELAIVARFLQEAADKFGQ